MNANVIKAILGVLLLLVVQVMFLNRIHLFGCATPLLLVYALIVLPLNTPRWLSLLTGFFLGLVSDAFTNTPGVAVVTLVFIAFIQPPLLKLFAPRDSGENLAPSMAALGTPGFLLYSLILTFLNCALLFLLESFDFGRLPFTLLCAAASTLLSYLFIFTFESIRGR